MLPSPILSLHSIQSLSPSPSLSFLRNSLTRRCRCGASAPQVLSRLVFSSKLFRMRSSKKHAANSRRIRSFKTQDLKPFRMCSSRKKGGPSFSARLGALCAGVHPDLVGALSFSLLRLLAQSGGEGSTVSTQLHSQEATQRPFAKNAKMNSYLGGDSVSTEAVAARRHAGTHLPVTWWKLEMPTTTWHLLLN
jgi:hypothetical protein